MRFQKGNQICKGRIPWNKGKKCPQLSGENNPFYGKHHTQKTIEKIRQSAIKQFKGGLPQATKDKISKAHKGKVNIGDSNGAKKPEVRKRLSEIRLQMFKDGLLNTPKMAFKKGNVPWILGKKHTEESLKRMSATKQGINRKDWKEFISFEPYLPSFDKDLKFKIRERDNFTCQECKKTELDLINENKYNRTLRIHHIDYNKKNNVPINLISLCQWCHVKTNRNRKHWQEYFNMKIFMKEFFNPKNILAFNENKQLVGVQRC